MRILFFLTYLLLGIILHAQNKNGHVVYPQWNYKGTTDYYDTISSLDFKQIPPDILQDSVFWYTFGMNDEAGRFLFGFGVSTHFSPYFITLWGKHKRMMSNFDSNDTRLHSTHGLIGGYMDRSITSGPVPGKSNAYYLFVGDSLHNYYYIDMNKDSGNGEIIKSKSLLNNSFASNGPNSEIRLIKAKNEIDFWLITTINYTDSSSIFAFKVDCNGVATIPITTTIPKVQFIKFLSIAPQHDGILISGKEYAHYLDFDNVTGEFLNHQKFCYHPFDPNKNYSMRQSLVFKSIMGVAFSPNGQNIYVGVVDSSFNSIIYKARRFVPNIDATLDTIFFQTASPNQYYHEQPADLELLPDGYIYVGNTCQGANNAIIDSLGIIMNSDNFATVSYQKDYISPWPKKRTGNQGGAFDITNFSYGMAYNINYDIVAFQDTMKCPTETIALGLDSVPSYSYSWSPSTGLSNPNTSNPLCSVRKTTIYTVIAGNGQCNDTLTIEVIVPFSDSLIANRGFICSSDSVLITHNNGEVVQWFNNGIPIPNQTSDSIYIYNSGTFILESRDTISGCIDRISITIDFKDPVQDSILCLSATLIPFVKNTLSQFQYKWEPSLLVSNDTTLSTNLIANTPTIYTLTASTNGICNDTAFIKVASGFENSINPIDTTICQGDSAQIRIKPLGLGYSLYRNTSFLLDTINNIFVTSAGNYSITQIEPITACVFSSNTISLKASNPSADFNTALLGTNFPVHIQTQNLSSPFIKAKWLINGVEVSSQNEPLISINSSGEYQVMLIIEDAFGCISSTSKTINIFNEDCILAPNAITPNEDGLNDAFELVSLCPIEEITIQIYNRWGQKVFESEDINDRFIPKDSEIAVYMYYISFKTTANGPTLFAKGNITVLK